MINLSTKNEKKNIIIAVVITAIVVGGTVGLIRFASNDDSNSLELYHWWTSGGEEEAINAVIGEYRTLYPNVSIFETKIAGGSGTAFLPVLKTLALAGDLPDAFQMHAGYEGLPYIDAGYIRQLDDLWVDNNLEDVIPDVVEDMCKIDGHYYSVPVNIHRNNVVWYSTAVLDDAGVNASEIENWTDFFAACDLLVTAGYTKPIALGESWTAVHTFEQILASYGMSFYEDFINGKVTDGTNATLVDALNTFKTYLSYSNEDSSTTQWPKATAKIINNESAFNIMGDWANGEFFVAGYNYGVEYDTFNVPGTADMYSVTIDTFMTPTNAPNPENAETWLELVASKDGQDAFNPIKGSISARTDANLTKYGDYQKAAIADFKATTVMYPSIQHGSAAPETFKTDFGNIISAFVADEDVTAAATAIAELASLTSDDWTNIWDLD